MSFNDDFEEMFRDLEIFDRRLMSSFLKEMDVILEGIKSGKLKGAWEVKQIDEPNAKGFAIQGHFGSEDTLEPLEPLKPFRPRPLPENPLQLSKKAMKEAREPLTDIFEDEDAVKIFVELPGEEENDIKLDVKEGQLEIKARNFYKIIELPKTPVAVDALSSMYRNGVLQITIPRKRKLRDKDAGKAKMV